MARLISTPEGYAQWVKLRELTGAPVGEAVAQAKPATPKRHAPHQHRDVLDGFTAREQERNNERFYHQQQERRAAIARIVAASDVTR